MPYSDYPHWTIAIGGEEIYRPLRNELESQHKGKIFVVDIEREIYI